MNTAPLRNALLVYDAHEALLDEIATRAEAHRFLITSDKLAEVVRAAYRDHAPDPQSAALAHTLNAEPYTADGRWLRTMAGLTS
jgi:hypothetical protein